jgi:hypothetical protein
MLVTYIFHPKIYRSKYFFNHLANLTRYYMELTFDYYPIEDRLN